MADHGCERRRERGRFDRLGDVHVESCRERQGAIFAARMSGQRHGGKTTAMLGLVLPNLPNHGIPVLTQQVDIAHQRVETPGPDCLKRLAGRRHCRHSRTRVRQHR